MSEPKKTRHFALEQWVDFARGVGADTEAARMAKHAVECERCREWRDFCVKLAAVCQRMTPVKRSAGG